MVTSQTTFPDIQTHWAKPFIEGLAKRGIVSGFPNGTFRPDRAMSRSEFAAILVKAFPKPTIRQYVQFIDVRPQFWAAEVIKKAYETGFLSGYPGNRFFPYANITRTEVLVSLVAGLKITTNYLNDARSALPKLYQDAEAIPVWAKDRIAIATDADIVVNYPHLNKLRPQDAATRADVAAFIYQTLFHQGKVPPVASEYIVRREKTVNVSHRREFRGVWVTTAWNYDWPSGRLLSVDEQKRELINILDTIAALKFNAIVLQIRPSGDAFYTSGLEPWSEWLTGTQGKPPEPFYDPLEFAIAEAHKRNLEFHAWFNLYRAKLSGERSPNVSPHIAITHPEYVYQYGSDLWMDPGAKVVQDLTYNVIIDVVRRYDIDGVHIDDYFYPYPKEGETFPDNKTYAAYQNSGGTLSLADWRRDNINQIIQRLYNGIHATKSYVKFGISPFGIYRPGQPPQIQGLDQYDTVYADPKKWLEQGWLDYLTPQLYWRIDQYAQSYPVLLNWWLDRNLKQRHIYPGNAIERLGPQELGGRGYTLEEFKQQIELTRKLAPQQALGNIFYSMRVFSQNRLNVVNYFQTEIYQDLALVPVMRWIDDIPPKQPVEVTPTNGKITWKPPTNTAIRAWTIYQLQGDIWKLDKILTPLTTTINVSPGTYAVATVDSLANESRGVVVDVD
ncbi:glycoside hydrolase family 10 protein [Oscillatoria salina]|uniref:glycoside hydrolase family 10 protein n=1 Tax=Oscillatoria salina TaxID=331517 RepID=UPI0013B8B09C|nr:family 10 glycosylhydrolase [Oscillatoria salina]MBZ8179996.1 family 10 glycosylhydrolase [Oscillatoria salina IIICB1]NET90341.1 family 10 glycosylhydrolase [Kamptonema sp. SIO1D9]